MTKKLGSFLMVAVVLTACSQRAPFRVVPASATKPQATASGQTSKASDGSVVTTGSAIKQPVSEPTDAVLAAHVGSLYFPVAGMDSTRLDDSYDAARDGGVRRHNAIDIMAPRGSAVLAVQDGRVLKLASNAKGGITVYASDLDEQFVYYYAHLDRYHARMYNGKPLMRGDTIGYVGTTGNSPANLPHLHFQIMRMPPDKRSFSTGAPVNPFPLLRTTAQTQASSR
jgi:murein DD-endopeptidase MepM/ murein hydrolase activator NlpD